MESLFEEKKQVKKIHQQLNKITGYTIYNAEQQRRTVRNDLPEFSRLSF